MATSSRSIGQKRSRSPRLKTGSIAFTRATNASRTSSVTRPHRLSQISRFGRNRQSHETGRPTGGGWRVGRKSGRRDRGNGLPRLVRVQSLRGSRRHRGGRVPVGSRDSVLREGPRDPREESAAPQGERPGGGGNGSML